MSIKLRDRDEEIVEALVLDVRLFSQRQIAEHWFHGELANSRRRLKQLSGQRLLERVVVRARTMPEFTEPIIDWRLGESEPSFSSASHKLRSRWQSRPVRDTTAWIATERAAQIYGGKGRGGIKQGLQVSHDLGVAAIWLHFDRHLPKLADAWRGEDLMASQRRNQKLPDAFLLDATGEPFCVVEFGGSYDEERVRAFHHDCALRQLPYQMW